MTPKSIFSKYLKALASSAAHGDATEESFYPALKQMLEEFATVTNRPYVDVTALPKPTEGGNPDFRLWNGKGQVIGYIEAKKPTEVDLNRIQGSEQLQRYRETFPNLILTNFLEFRLYRRGRQVAEICAGQPFVLNTLGTTPPLEKQSELEDLLDRFMDFALPADFTADAESLAVELAKRTRHLRDVISEETREDRDSGDDLTGFYEAFRTYLIGSLTLPTCSHRPSRTGCLPPASAPGPASIGRPRLTTYPTPSAS